MKPIIGITLDLQNDSEEYTYSKYPWYALRQNYSKSIAAVGGVPIMLPTELELIDEVVNLIDGLLITGGAFDIHPRHYGQEIISDKIIISESRTDYEFALFKKAREKNLPILGICNGMQVINVVSGGTLIQDIPTIKPSAINHEQPHPKDIPTHDLQVVEGTKLFEIVGKKSHWSVNTTHHQAIDKLGEGLITSALAPDGIIEAIEVSGDEFILGVEWHPEYLGCGDIDYKIFEAFINASRRYKQYKHN